MFATIFGEIKFLYQRLAIQLFILPKEDLCIRPRYYVSKSRFVLFFSMTFNRRGLQTNFQQGEPLRILLLNFKCKSK